MFKDGEIFGDYPDYYMYTERHGIIKCTLENIGNMIVDDFLEDIDKILEEDS